MADHVPEPPRPERLAQAREAVIRTQNPSLPALARIIRNTIRAEA